MYSFKICDKMKELTKAEEEIMQLLWKLEQSTVAGLLEKMKSPKLSI